MLIFFAGNCFVIWEKRSTRRLDEDVIDFCKTNFPETYKGLYDCEKYHRYFFDKKLLRELEQFIKNIKTFIVLNKVTVHAQSNLEDAERFYEKVSLLYKKHGYAIE